MTKSIGVRAESSPFHIEVAEQQLRQQPQQHFQHQQQQQELKQQQQQKELLSREDSFGYQQIQVLSEEDTVDVEPGYSNVRAGTGGLLVIAPDMHPDQQQQQQQLHVLPSAPPPVAPRTKYTSPSTTTASTQGPPVTAPKPSARLSRSSMTNTSSEKPDQSTETFELTQSTTDASTSQDLQQQRQSPKPKKEARRVRIQEPS